MNNEFQPQPDTLKMVTEFHHTFLSPVLLFPAIPEDDRCQLRVSLISEELDELKEAIEKKDIVAIADALCDLQYVLTGAVLEFGLGRLFNNLFNEVHRSNMSKACETLDEVEKSAEKYVTEGVSLYSHFSNGKFLLFRKGDNKTLKSINYSPADLRKIIVETLSTLK